MSTATLRAALLGLAALPLATPALAQQSDAATRQLIERLRPTEQQTRGIRMPGADSGTAAPASPSLTPAAPSTGKPDGMPPTAAARPPAPAQPPRDTTAPAGVAAVSITVNFASGSANLTPQAMASLTNLGRALASSELASYRFRIEGHTDTVGDAQMNMALSQRRAEAVRDFLSQRFQIAPDRLVATGMGESQLLVRTGDERDEPRNRRVQVLNLGS
ncbi:OmpA family protein [Roseococcus sp. YIM B11640]|uniref:OmpA family protein n=1 Tax=Roseococcus sp. YIM B11640 TaxID=3133973 RepID=UPI003C7ED68B